MCVVVDGVEDQPSLPHCFWGGETKNIHNVIIDVVVEETSDLSHCDCLGIQIASLPPPTALLLDMS